MPKSKRNKVVTLSKTKKKGQERKESLVKNVRGSVEAYAALYVFRYENMRNAKFKEFRERLNDSSRFYLGSNKVMQLALGRSASDEVEENLHKISERITGNRGLFFTNMKHEEAMRLFEEFEESDFARAGSIATETVEYPAGPLEQFVHDQEPYLRQNGMPTKLNKGVVELVSDYVVCTEGEPLTPEASRLLRLFGVQMAAFRLVLECRWSGGEFTLLPGAETANDVKAGGTGNGDAEADDDDDGPVDITPAF